MAIDEAVDKPGDVAGAFGFAAGAVDTLTGEFANAGKYDRTDIHDADEMAEYKRGKIENEHQGLRGVAGYVYSHLGLVPSYQSEMNTLTDAQDSAHRADATSAVASEAQKSQQQLQQLRQQMDAAVSNQNKTAYQRDLENVNANFNQTVTAANSIANDKTFFSQGFHSQADANAYVEHLKNDAEKIHNSDLAKLAGDRYDEMQTGNEQLEVLQRLGAGDKVGAAREALESGLNAKERQIDPNDIEKIKQYEQISKQSLANFDAGAARQSKLQESQTDDQIAGFQEEAKEAQLRAAGRDDEAMVAALTFSTQQRVRSLQEQVDAEIDPTRKANFSERSRRPAMPERSKPAHFSNRFSMSIWPIPRHPRCRALRNWVVPI